VSLITPAMLDALRRWMTDNTGFVAYHWKADGTPNPLPPYVQLTLQRVQRRGTTDAVSARNFNAANVGAELSTVYDGVRELSVSVQVVSDLAAGSGDATSKMADALANLETESRRSDLAVNGLSFIDADPIQDVPVLLETRWSQRATMDLRFRVMSETTETSTYIQTVQLTPTFS
jgi:hypothetical protein